ncbi:MAG TPA: pyridoxamine kinase [Candidatus Gallacutalibacter stercoravium]|nr:pyridoxamine kinase [Candidatus Gallacutalibacter stercoravium]
MPDAFSTQKRIAAIHDISGFGKCSLTVVLPILSATGVEACALPTAVLSTHTGGFTGYTMRDLTEDLLPIAKHWRSLNLHFDALYSGFLASYEQIDLVSRIFDLLSDAGTLCVVDPCMADNGKLYRVYSPDMVQGMKQLCAKAGLLIPNITEAAMLADMPYRPDLAGDRVYLQQLLEGLASLGCPRVVLTGVRPQPGQIGAACYEKGGLITYASAQEVAGHYHGTGDVFASALLGGMMRGLGIRQSAQVAADFTARSIARSAGRHTDERYGVAFEEELPFLINALGLHERVLNKKNKSGPHGPLVGP